MLIPDLIRNSLPGIFHGRSAAEHDGRGPVVPLRLIHYDFRRHSPDPSVCLCLRILDFDLGHLKFRLVAA
jgi:hypothetical protein